jgi:GMP synthase-like glutamine amidotransferase
MRALFIQQDHVSPPGPVGEQFTERGYDVEEFLVVPAEHFSVPSVEVSFPDPLDYDVVVPMGAPWSVYDHRTIGAWVLEEIAMLRRAHEHGVPVLGICFGGQALATALGGAVERAPGPEVGWVTFDSDDHALLEPGPWFEWHYDRWTRPPGARAVARTAAAEQAFVLGRSLGLQFHPEITATQLELWLDNSAPDYPASLGLVRADLLADMKAREADAATRTRRLVDRFVDRVATAAPA